MASQYVNKFVKDGVTKFDLTNDTVTADTLVSGRTAHLASGVQVTGTFEPVTGVKGNAESTYRKGNVNLTPANIGAATSAQGAKADSAVQTIQIGGTTQTKTSGTVNLPAYPTKSSLGLGNVDNTSDANKPISTATQAEFDKQQAQIDYNSNQGVKNLFKITAESQTINGVTFTVDKAAGTITTNGTATAALWFTLYNVSLSSGEYTLNGCPSGGSLGTYSLVLYYDASSQQAVDTGEGNTFSANATEARLIIRIGSGATLSNLVFKPMIRDASIKDNTFEPYAMSNAELTQKVEDISDCLYIEAYNAGTAITIQNTSDFTLDLFTKFSTSDQMPKFAFLKLSGRGTTYYLRAMINVEFASPGATIDVSFIADGTTLYKFGWYMQSGTVSTPTITAKTLSFA